MKMGITALAILAASGLSACGGASEAQNEAVAEDSAGDTFGATGAPGADLTDNGAGDAANGLTEGNESENELGTGATPGQ